MLSMHAFGDIYHTLFWQLKQNNSLYTFLIDNRNPLKCIEKRKLMVLIFKKVNSIVIFNTNIIKLYIL